MCGVVGFCDFTKETKEDILKMMTDELHHRGPDDTGISFIENSKYNLGLGHKRLSILDLTIHGHQPMNYKDIKIIFNGEIYNFREIREELINSGYEFNSDNDTEVILKSYHKWGIDAIKKFNGMFAIIIYDRNKNSIKVIRDRTGIKPIFWYFKNNLLMFSSELKSFHKHKKFEKIIDSRALQSYLQHGYIVEPYSIFKNTHKLKAGFYLDINLKNKVIKEIEYWSLLQSYNSPKLDITPNEAIEEVHKLLKSSFNYRMISDVPVGVFLSGGYDSSAVTAILQNSIKNKLNTFTIGFKEKGFDEAPYAKKVSSHLGTNHTEYYCTQKDATDIIPTLPKIYDEPFGDSSAIPTILVSKLAKKNVTVALSADGGDEIFAGYKSYDTALKYYIFFNKFPKKSSKIISKIMDNINPEYIPFTKNIYNFETRYENIKYILKDNKTNRNLKYLNQLFTYNQIKELIKIPIQDLITNFETDVNKLDNIDRMLAIDYKTYLVDDILTKVDKATMSVSLEGREPLLDYRIVEFVSKLPTNLKYNNGNKKWILKEIVHKYLPKKLMDRPKMGFAVPIVLWFRKELKELLFYYLNKERLDKENIFNVDKIIILRDDYIKGNNKNIKQLWYILMFEMWYEEWM